MAVYRTEDEILEHCNFSGDLREKLREKYSPNHPWVLDYVVEHSAENQHFTAYFRTFDRSRRLAVGVKRIDGKYHYTFPKK